MRRTKIVCTIGPSCCSPEALRALIDCGMNVARLNFSHGTHEGHAQTFAAVRAAADEMGKKVGIMMDLQGPKIRTGKLLNGSPVHLNEGESFTITTEPVAGTAECVSTTYENLSHDVSVGNHIFLCDGIIDLEVEEVRGPQIICHVVHGGYLGEHQGINLPGVRVSSPSLTDKDREDLAFGLDLDFDFVALSFVRAASDVEDLREQILAAGKSASVIAKIERSEAVENFPQILQVADAIMLARGDLGVEVPLHDVPQIQKRLIGLCNDEGVPVITATQMLESMMIAPRPTRAEVADVANAVYDGADALMLSGETASGRFPNESVQVMARIAESADEAMAKAPTYDRIVRMRQSAIRHGEGAEGDAIGQAACRTAQAVGARHIVCFTSSGTTAALIARYRPTVPITVLTMSEEARRRCSLIWGVDAIHAIEPCSTDEMDGIIDEVLLAHGLAQPGDRIVAAGGMPLAMRSSTNMLKIHTVAEPQSTPQT